MALSRHERRIGLLVKVVLVLVALLLLWQWPGGGLGAIMPHITAFYALLNAGLLLLAHPSRTAATLKGVALLSFALDVGFASLLVYGGGGVESDLYLLYALITFRAALLGPIFPVLVVACFGFGPLYIVLLRARLEESHFLLDRAFLLRYGLLFALLLLACSYAWTLIDNRRQVVRFQSRLGEKSEDLDQKTQTLQHTAQHLGNRLRELRSLQEGVKAINAALAIDATLSLIVTNASHVLGGARCAIGLLEDELGMVRMRATSANATSAPQLPGATFALTEGVAGWVVANAKAARIDDVSRDERFKQLPSNHTITSILGIPLIADGVAIGALCATSPEPAAFGPEALDLLAAFADQAAMAVKNARLYERVDSARRQAEGSLQQIMALNDVGRALVSTLNMEETLALIVERLVSLAGTSHCAVTLLDERGEALVGRAVFGGPPSEKPPTFRIGIEEEPAVCRALEARVPVAVHAAPTTGSPAQQSFAAAWGVQSYLITPLISRETVIGALYLGDDRPNFVFGEAERELTTSFASFAATAIENARLYQDVREKSAEIEAVVHGIGDGVMVTDTNLQLVLVNPIAASIFGVAEHIRPGTPLFEVITDRGLIELLETAVGAPREDPMMGEVTVRSARTGEERIYQALSSLVMGTNGQPRGIVTVLRDVTAQKELERMKSNFLSVISHELKTPLHSIKGFVDIILMGKTGPINELQRDFLSTVKDQTTQLQTLIQDLLEFSRLESGQLKLRPEPFDIGELASKVADKLNPVAAEGEVILASLVPIPAAEIEADPVRIEQVMSNLCDNAIKFTPPGGRVTIGYQDHGAMIELTVSDTGIGIPQDEIGRIFDRFYQVDGSSTRRYRGTGLGLTICKHIVEHHGGRIWVESSLNRGSTFHLTLPKQLPSEEALTIDFARLQHRD